MTTNHQNQSVNGNSAGNTGTGRFSSVPDAQIPTGVSAPPQTNKLSGFKLSSCSDVTMFAAVFTDSALTARPKEKTPVNRPGGPRSEPGLRDGSVVCSAHSFQSRRPRGSARGVLGRRGEKVFPKQTWEDLLVLLRVPLSTFNKLY